MRPKHDGELTRYKEVFLIKSWCEAFVNVIKWYGKCILLNLKSIVLKLKVYNITIKMYNINIEAL